MYPTSVFALAHPAEGEWGWCIHVEPTSGKMDIVLYDDDDHECHCETRPCEYGPECVAVAVCKPSWDSVDALETSRSWLYRIPDGDFDYRHVAATSAREGWIYAVALNPDTDLGRIKVGWTTQPLRQRISKYRTTNPTQLVLGLWDAYRRQESRILNSLRGRIGTSEVFQVGNAWALVAEIRKALR